MNNPKNEKLTDLTGRELATFIPLVIIAFWIGLYPKPFFQILSTPVNNLVATVRPDYPGLTKPVVAGQPTGDTQTESPAALPEAPKAPVKRTSPADSSRNADRRDASAAPGSGRAGLQACVGESCFKPEPGFQPGGTGGHGERKSIRRKRQVRMNE